jgi:hypothetical protein
MKSLSGDTVSRNQARRFDPAEPDTVRLKLPGIHSGHAYNWTAGRLADFHMPHWCWKWTLDVGRAADIDPHGQLLLVEAFSFDRYPIQLEKCLVGRLAAGMQAMP